MVHDRQTYLELLYARFISKRPFGCAFALSVESVGQCFFSHNKSSNIIFYYDFLAKRTTTSFSAKLVSQWPRCGCYQCCCFYNKKGRNVKQFIYMKT